MQHGFMIIYGTLYNELMVRNFPPILIVGNDSKCSICGVKESKFKCSSCHPLVTYEDCNQFWHVNNPVCQSHEVIAVEDFVSESEHMNSSRSVPNSVQNRNDNTKPR